MKANKNSHICARIYTIFSKKSFKSSRDSIHMQEDKPYTLAHIKWSQEAHGMILRMAKIDFMTYNYTHSHIQTSYKHQTASNFNAV